MRILNGNSFQFSLCLLILVLVAATCSNSDDLGTTRKKLNEAEQLWSALGIESYTYTIVYRGFLPHDSLTVVVAQNLVVRVIDLKETDTLSDQMNASFYTIDDLFIEIGGKLDELAEESVKLSFNDTAGYPESVYYDEGEEGWGYKIVSFDKH